MPRSGPPSGFSPEPHAASRTFVEEVARQLARFPGLGTPGEEESRMLVSSLLAGVERGAGESAAAALAADPVLLSLFFQNADLLYGHGYPAADAVSLAVMDALGRLPEDAGG